MQQHFIGHCSIDNHADTNFIWSTGTMWVVDLLSTQSEIWQFAIQILLFDPTTDISSTRTLKTCIVNGGCLPKMVVNVQPS